MQVKKVFLKKLSKNIDAIRKRQGISFSEMALRCDMGKSTVVEIITEQKNITVFTLYRLSEGLEVPIEEFFNFLDEGS